MKIQELLIDQVYSSCFVKKQERPMLRAMLEKARRFVLDDAMSAFLADLNFETFTGRYLRIKPHRRKIHFDRGIDSVRHFARLPHKITWFEYSHAAKDRRTKELVREAKCEEFSFGSDLDAPSDNPGRQGWLMWQHDSIETAFSARPWSHRYDGSSGSVPIALMWDTENNPLPWRQIPLPEWMQELSISHSEFALIAKGYKRDNVGLRNVSGELDTPLHAEHSEIMEASLRGMFGQLQHVWTFLSTLNKIPLVGEQKIQRSHGFIARGRYRRFLEHSIVTITIPGKADVRKIAQRTLHELRRRAHQVRGHWRDDWHKPKGNKEIWVPEHQRGDASLGFVTHDYSVKHEKGKDNAMDRGRRRTDLEHPMGDGDPEVRR